MYIIIIIRIEHIRVQMERKHSGMYTDKFRYTSNADILVYTECKHSDTHGMQIYSNIHKMQTFGYTRNVDIQIYIKCRHSGIHGM